MSGDALGLGFGDRGDEAWGKEEVERRQEDGRARMRGRSWGVVAPPRWAVSAEAAACAKPMHMRVAKGGSMAAIQDEG